MQSRFLTMAAGYGPSRYLITRDSFPSWRKSFARSSVEYISRCLEAHFMQPRTMTLWPTLGAWRP